MTEGINDPASLKKACLDKASADAEQAELRARRRGAAFTPAERELLDGYKAKLIFRIEKQTDDYWRVAVKADKSPAAIIGELCDDLKTKYESQMKNSH